MRCAPVMLVLFTRQLATMLRSGVSLVDSLHTLADQPEDPNFAAVVEELAARISEGHNLSNSLHRFPRVFSDVYVAMVTIGENTGNLDEALERLAVWKEDDYKLFQKVKGALTYPAFVLSLTLFLTLTLFYTVLPGFLDIFREMKIELPLMTRILIQLTDAVENPGIWVLGIAWLFAMVFWIRTLQQSRKGSAMIFNFLLGIPVLGGMLKQATVSRYAGSAAALLESGLDVSRTLRMAAVASGSPVLRADSDSFISAVEQGEQLSAYMIGRPDLYPESLTQMVLAGEESSSVGPMYERAAAYFEAEVGYRIDTLSAILEPLLLGVLAFIVGFIVIGILVPLYSYLGTLA